MKYYVITQQKIDLSDPVHLELSYKIDKSRPAQTLRLKVKSENKSILILKLKT